MSYIPVHTSNNVEATFDFVERIVRPVAFDNVASTLSLVWTELYFVRQQPYWISATYLHTIPPTKFDKSNEKPLRSCCKQATLLLGCTSCQ